MFLKKIEIFGFKSFAEKTKLDFSPGVSAIIGPNGCGKSNIVDAVRWALGEQSARTLRGYRMEEIIFSGSEERKPLNYSEVSLLFDGADRFLNLEYTEVEITRRLYRSGESEYFINKTPCRLKDINDLFMDTGVGREVYSIIGQNRIEEIINTRPEERRELFWEAAGILKYKHRKREAQRRLDEMKDNLQRVEDLICELENQQQPLEEEASVARQFLGLQSRLKETEEGLMAFKIREHRRRLERSSQRYDQIQKELSSASGQFARNQVYLQEFYRKRQEINKKRDLLERELNSVSRQKDNIEGRQRLLEEKNRHTKSQIDENEVNIKRLEERLKAVEVNLKQWEAENDAKVEEAEKNRGRVEELERRLEEIKDSDLLQTVEGLQRRQASLSSRREALESTLGEMEKREQKLSINLDNLNEQILDEEKRFALTGVEIADAKQEMIKKEALFGKHLEKTGALRLKLSDTAEKKKLIESEKSRVKEKLVSRENRLWLLQRWEEKQGKKGPQQGLSEIMTSWNKKEPLLKGVLGALHSVISVSPPYRAAVEAALGETLYSVVTSDENAARKAVEFLKSGKKGRANFLPSNISNTPIRGEQLAPLMSLPGVLGTALEFMEIKPPFRDSVAGLLRDVLVVENLEQAIHVAREAEYSATVVTLEGEAVYSGGLIRGGWKDSEGEKSPWSKEDEISEIKARISQESGKLRELDAEIDALSRIESSANSELDNLERQESGWRTDLAALERKIDTLSMEERYIKDNVKRLKSSLEELEKEKADLSGQRARLNDELQKLASENIEVTERLERNKAGYQLIAEEKDAVQEGIARHGIEYNKSLEQQKYLSEKILQGKKEKEAFEREIRERADGNLRLSAQRLELEREAAEEEKNLAQLAEKSAGISREFEKVSVELASLQSELGQLEKEKEDIMTNRQRLERRDRQHEIERTRLQADKDHLESTFMEKFGVTWEQAAGEEGLKVDEEESLRQINSLKEEMEALGDVKVGSIEELERLSSRITFLSEQKADLKQGEESLLKALEQIDREIARVFRETLEKIGENMQSTFSALFGGGQAFLRLTDPDDLLESGVEIVAQPPGKKLQNISLLSSGEKALTAIALIFAIMTYKPAPFYFLDEIESSLDDTNLTMFTEYLKESSRFAQFILITHRKRTMETADRVYGITMHETGISRSISLKLDKKVS